MPTVESSIFINGDIERVYALAKDIESFPEFMPDVKSVTVLEKSDSGDRTVVEWVGIVKEFKTTVKWVEEDLWNDEAKTCEFNMLRGDYSSYSGIWKFESVDGGAQFTSILNFEYDVPLIGALIKGLIAKKMKENVDNILTAIKGKVEQG
ncbi:MAG: SRPBCC family protein [Armatimonadota bacterium]|nr:SRPBCC family protein [Armatimonadota bacterium]